MATTKEKQDFLQAKLEGKNDKEAALIAKPDIKEQSAAVVGHRLATDPDVQQALLQTLEDNGLTYEKILKPIAEGLEATKVIVMGKGTEDSFVDLTPDWSARLKAADMAIKLLLLKKGSQTPDKAPEITPQLEEAIKRGDIKELQRIIFKTGIELPVNEEKGMSPNITNT